jgi:hypothetical protein
MMFAFTDYVNAAEKCAEFSERTDPSLVGVVLRSFSQVYSGICASLGIIPFDMEDAARRGCASIWAAIEKYQKPVLAEFRLEHDRLWNRIGVRTPVFFTVHAVAHTWKGNTPTRAMWAPGFWDDGDPKNPEHREATELGLLVHDEVSMGDLVEIERAELIEWVHGMAGADPVWAQQHLSLKRALKAYEADVAAHGFPQIDGKAVPVTFERARLLVTTTPEPRGPGSSSASPAATLWPRAMSTTGRSGIPGWCGPGCGGADSAGTVRRS